MSHIVYVEGLWHTGKSFFLDYVRNLCKPSDNVLVFDNLRSLKSVRHAAYTIYPRVYSQSNLLFDRSPVTLKVISNPSLRSYYHESIDYSYWVKFYDEWKDFLVSSKNRVSFIYFRPFETGSSLIKREIVDYLLKYSKSDLMVDPLFINEKFLYEIHNLFLREISKLYPLLKPRFDFYQVDYRDSNEALDIIKYIQFIPSLKREISDED